ncbi:hypothetical protein [uncultured Sphingomonas sp.]|uniref:hypothetical protein n=1 Tax=Sphingomonas sp. TaxID=28214 RepID=UPI002617EDA3|nr:hypothetical protein [uncultured Sphingomonas sp.]
MRVASPAAVDHPTLSPIAVETITRAVRVWRAARDAHRPVLPALHALLAPIGHDMLAPVIDSVLRLGEQCLDRTPCRDCPFGSQTDVELLVDLLRDPRRVATLPRCAQSTPRAKAVFAGALASAGVMMAMA